MPAAAWRPNNGSAPDSVAQDNPNAAAAPITSDAIVEGIRQVAMKLEDKEKERLVQGLQALIDELKSRKGAIAKPQ
jgi:hypothetical protein